MYFQIIITGKCNFACTYCMQKVKNNKTMNLKTVQKTISFISSFFLKKEMQMKVFLLVFLAEKFYCILIL